jgi:hypothetical protein
MRSSKSANFEPNVFNLGTEDTTVRQLPLGCFLIRVSIV